MASRIFSIQTISDWPSVVLHNVCPDAMHCTCNRLVESLTGVPDGLRTETARLNDVSVYIMRCNRVTLPILAVDLNQPPVDSLLSFIETCIQQRSVLHPGHRHVVILYGLESLSMKVKLRIGRLAQQCSSNAVFVFILASCGTLPTSLRGHFVFMNITRSLGTSQEASVDGPLDSTQTPTPTLIDKIVRDLDGHLTMAKKFKAAASMDHRALLTAMSKHSSKGASLAAEADLQMCQTGQCWGIVSRHLVCAWSQV